jgi:hypothetical protein
MFISIITDKSEAENLATSLRDKLPSPMSYSNSLKAVLTPEIKTEDDEVASYPINITKVEVVNSKDLFLK